MGNLTKENSLLEFTHLRQTDYIVGNKMALINTVNPSDLYHMACRMDRGHNFGYNGWRAIGEYLEELSDDIGEDVEVDIVGICCEYSMSEDVSDWWDEYGEYSDIDSNDWENMDNDEKLEAIRDYLQENTGVVICEDDLIIWQAF